MPVQHRPKRNKKTSVLYQPRRMTLTRNNHIHVLGMSLSHLNISISYKNRIKALLTNNKALAYALAQAQHEISIKDKEIFDLRRKQSRSNVPKQVKFNLQGICQHMDGMMKLLNDSLSVCNSEDLVSSPFHEASRSRSTSTGTGNSETPCRLPSQNCSNRENLAQWCVREERWLNNMSTIEEQSMTETESLPPILFTNDDATKQYKKVQSRSKSRSLTEDAFPRTDKYAKKSKYLTSCLENPDIDNPRSCTQSKSDIGQTSQLRPAISNVSSEEEKAITECPGLTSTVQQGHSPEAEKESLDNDTCIAIRLDPQMLSQVVQACSPVAVHEQDLSTPFVIEAPLSQKPSLEVGVTCSAESKTDFVHDNVPTEINRTSTVLMDMELTGTVSQSAIASIQSGETQLQDMPLSKDLSSKDKKIKLRAKKLRQKVSELTQSFLELSSAEKDDPEYKPSKCKAKSSHKTKKAAVPSVRKDENPSFRIFSASPNKRKRKASKTTAKASKQKSKKCTGKVSVKRDINEHPSAIYDFSLGDSLLRSIVEPYKPPTKSSSPEKETCSSDGPLQEQLINQDDNRKVVENEKHQQKTKFEDKRKSSKTIDTDDSNLCKDILPKRRSSRGKFSPKVLRNVLKSCDSKPDLLSEVCSNSNSALVSRQSSTNSSRRHKKNSSETEGRLADPISQRISGKISSGKENLPSPRQSTDHNFEGQRASRHQKTPVSYKEPSLRKKIRRE